MGGRGKKVIVLSQNHTTLRAAWPHAGEGNGTASAARRFRRPHASRRAAPNRKTALRASHAARGRAALKDWHSAGRVPRRSYSLHSQAPCSQSVPLGALTIGQSIPLARDLYFVAFRRYLILQLFPAWRHTLRVWAPSRRRYNQPICENASWLGDSPRECPETFILWHFRYLRDRFNCS